MGELPEKLQYLRQEYQRVKSTLAGLRNLHLLFSTQLLTASDANDSQNQQQTFLKKEIKTVAVSKL